MRNLTIATTIAGMTLWAASVGALALLSEGGRPVCTALSCAAAPRVYGLDGQWTPVADGAAATWVRVRRPAATE